jgi:hypothetical protein
MVQTIVKKLLQVASGFPWFKIDEEIITAATAMPTTIVFRSLLSLTHADLSRPNTPGLRYRASCATPSIGSRSIAERACFMPDNLLRLHGTANIGVVIRRYRNFALFIRQKQGF